MIVARQRGNADKDIAKLAHAVVAQWKAAVEAEKKARLHSSSTPKPTSDTATPDIRLDSTNTHTESKQEKFIGDASKRKWNDDGADINRTDSATRNNCIGLIYNGLAFNSYENCQSVMCKALEVEKAAFVKCKGETEDYRKKIRSLFANLKNRQNKDLGPSVMSEKISAERFVTMSQEELKSDILKKLEEELEKDNLKKAQVPMAERSISDALKCGKCGQKKVSYSQAQTRSADEPMTTFCDCTVCGNRWKVRYFDFGIIHFMLTLYLVLISCLASRFGSTFIYTF